MQNYVQYAMCGRSPNARPQKSIGIDSVIVCVDRKGRCWVLRSWLLLSYDDKGGGHCGRWGWAPNLNGASLVDDPPPPGPRARWPCDGVPTPHFFEGDVAHGGRPIQGAALMLFGGTLINAGAPS